MTEEDAHHDATGDRGNNTRGWAPRCVATRDELALTRRYRCLVAEDIGLGGVLSSRHSLDCHLNCLLLKMPGNSGSTLIMTVHKGFGYKSQRRIQG